MRQIWLWRQKFGTGAEFLAGGDKGCMLNTGAGHSAYASYSLLALLSVFVAGVRQAEREGAGGGHREGGEWRGREDLECSRQVHQEHPRLLR